MEERRKEVLSLNELLIKRRTHELISALNGKKIEINSNIVSIERLISWNPDKPEIQKAGNREKKELELDRKFINDFIEQINHFTAIHEDRIPCDECICTKGLEKCDKICVF